MSKILEEIIKAPSTVREQWLSPDLAVREILAFERSFGSKHLMLACHAALPLILTPELLNLIHINFLDDKQIPWFAEVDFLLSSLCRPIDDGVYEVEPSIREVLLLELEKKFGLERPSSLANFLQFYLDEKSGLKQSLEVTRTQLWIAQAYIDPNKIIIELTNLLESSLSQNNDIFSLSQKIQVTRMLEILTDALQHTNQWNKYQYLIGNSRVVAKMLYGDEQALKRKIRQEHAKGNIDNSTLKLLSFSILKILGINQKANEDEINYLFETIETRFLANPQNWNLNTLYKDLSSAKQILSRGKEKELTPFEKQCLHVMLFLDNERNYYGYLSPKEIKQIEQILNSSNLSLYRYIEQITKKWRETH
ncbi:hypothetical protein NSTC745_02445 [Nostoc sp. DSM 114161]|jgi:hypothetical protein|uniref:hypothetical protein n=1 Tax=Nostoc sp. DSM 114161 TaxID=3440143 RepID=UPI004045AB90